MRWKCFHGLRQANHIPRSNAIQSSTKNCRAGASGHCDGVSIGWWEWSRCDHSARAEWAAPVTSRPMADEACAPLCAARRLAARAVPPRWAAWWWWWWEWSRCDHSARAERAAPVTSRPMADEACAPLCAARRLAARAVPPRWAAKAGEKREVRCRWPWSVQPRNRGLTRFSGFNNLGLVQRRIVGFYGVDAPDALFPWCDARLPHGSHGRLLWPAEK